MPRSTVIRIPSDVPTFDVVDAVTPVGTAPCAECHDRIVDTYFEADQSVICAACHDRIVTSRATHASGGRFGRALALGLFAAIAGASAYFALLAITGRELIVVVLLVGFIVGKAVRIGSRARGGRRFQWLAVVLTYLAIVTTYVPFVVKGYSRRSPAVAEAIAAPSQDGSFLTVAMAPTRASAPGSSLGDTAVGFGALLLLALVAPLLEGTSNLFGLLITFAALYQAWRMNREVAVVITGPYHVRA